MENIIQLDFSEEMKNSYRDYAMSVIISRALPDIRDGLKPVQRRILYAMNELSLSPDKPHRKSARIVGDTMGKYHPHGDSSIYDALVHMTEDYSLSIPLVDGHGNFGSIDGDGAAAMRYTEARLSKGAMTLLNNLDKGLVNFIPNFDESEKEPEVLPAMIPNLLVNGTTGIAVGMATNIPPHNFSEVIEGIIAYMDNNDITIEKLMKYIKGPDFPTGGIIINQEDIKSIYETGEGKIRIRAKHEIENSDNGRKNIVITQIPYTIAGNKTKLVESLVSLMKDKVFDEIFDVRDESSKEGIRIVIEVKKDRNIDNLLNGLYKKTQLEDTYSVNLLAVKQQQPIVFNLKSIIKEFVDFQENLYINEFEYLLKKSKDRLEIINGLIKATNVIDLIIEILRGSSSIKQAKDCIINGNIENIKFKSKEAQKQAIKLNFTERQADAILSMSLSKLIGLEILKLHEEYEVLNKNIQQYELILSDKKQLHQVIKTRLRTFKKEFGKQRITLLENIKNIEYVEEIKIEDIYVLIDKFGYTKSIDNISYARISEDTLKEYKHIIKMKNTDKLCIFTANGNMYQIKASILPKCKIKEKGTLIQNICKVGKEDIIKYMAFEDVLNSMLMFTTKNGLIKLVSGTLFQTNRNMITSTKLEENDLLVDLCSISKNEMLDDNKKVIIYTSKGLALLFMLNEVSEMKKTGKGIKAIELDKNDEVIFSKIIDDNTEYCEYLNKKLLLKKIKLAKRANKGKKIILI